MSARKNTDASANNSDNDGSNRMVVWILGALLPQSNGEQHTEASGWDEEHQERENAGECSHGVEWPNSISSP
jgi:hypothetical protein